MGKTHGKMIYQITSMVSFPRQNLMADHRVLILNMTFCYGLAKRFLQHIQLLLGCSIGKK